MPKNHSKILPKPILGGAKKMDTPFSGLFKAALNGMSRCHFRRPLSNGTHLANLRRRQKTSQESRHHQNLEARKRFQPQNYRLLHFIWKIYKNVKIEDPYHRLATSLISGDCKQSLFKNKNCNFAWEGWSKLKIHYFLQKNISWRVFWRIVRMSHAKSPLLRKRMPTISGVQK